jgi:hypothetical protein
MTDQTAPIQTFETLADLLEYHGVDSIERLSRVLFKNTACGMFAEEPNDRDRAEGVELVVGSIVEGSDSVFSERLSFPLPMEVWESALDTIEGQAEDAWNEANDSSDDDDEALT